MPLLTRASAADLTRSSLTVQPKRFQLFQPMGGVRTKPFSRARAGGTQKRNARHKGRQSNAIIFAKLFIGPSRHRATLLATNRTAAQRKYKQQKMEGSATRMRYLIPLGGGTICR